MVARFGFPNNMGRNGDDTLFFLYHRPGNEEENLASFNFKDGFLIYYGIDLPDR